MRRRFERPRDEELAFSQLSQLAGRVGMFVQDFDGYPKFCCPKCDEEVETDTLRCPFCGASLVNMDLKMKEAVCPTCGLDINRSNSTPCPEILSLPILVLRKMVAACPVCELRGVQSKMGFSYSESKEEYGGQAGWGASTLIHETFWGECAVCKTTYSHRN